MKRCVAVISLFTVLLLAFSACKSTTETMDASLTWQEQYDLGARYLEEGNYEEAIIAFSAAIEIDPKRSEAYSALADAYIGAGDAEKAIEILERGYADAGDAGLYQRLLEQRLEQGNETLLDEDDVAFTRRLVEETGYYASGDISNTINYTYDSAGHLVEESYPLDGSDSARYTYADDRVIESGGGTYDGIYTYDTAGRLQKYEYTYGDYFGEYLILYDAEGKVSQVIKSGNDSERTAAYSYTDGVCTSILEDGVTHRVNYHLGYQYPFVVVKEDVYEVFTKTEADVAIWVGDWLINSMVVPTIEDFGNITCDTEGYPIKNESVHGWYSTYSYEEHG